MKRQYRTSVKCAHEGCMEMGYYTYDTRREYMDGVKWRQRHPYRCIRHRSINEVLSMELTEREKTLVVEENPSGRYWNGSRGFVHGDGYKAFAEDFPVGTKLIVTAKIILP